MHYTKPNSTGSTGSPQLRVLKNHDRLPPIHVDSTTLPNWRPEHHRELRRPILRREDYATQNQCAELTASEELGTSDQAPPVLAVG